MQARYGAAAAPPLRAVTPDARQPDLHHIYHIEPEALARLVGWSTTLRVLAPRLRCSHCGKKAAEVVAVAKPRPRGIPQNPH
jgi:hypothetical protein